MTADIRFACWAISAGLSSYCFCNTCYFVYFLIYAIMTSELEET